MEEEKIFSRTKPEFLKQVEKVLGPNPIHERINGQNNTGYILFLAHTFCWRLSASNKEESTELVRILSDPLETEMLLNKTIEAINHVRLSSKQKEILRLRYNLDKPGELPTSLEKVGQQLENPITKEGVRQKIYDIEIKIRRYASNNKQGIYGFGGQ